MNLINLNKNILDKIYKEYHNNLLLDPVWVVRKLKNKEDIVTFAFVAALFSYGNIKNIIKFLESLLKDFNYQPYFSIKGNILLNKKYRFQSQEDINTLIAWLSYIIKKYSNLENYYFYQYKKCAYLEDLVDSIYKDYLHYLEENNIKLSHGLKFLLNTPLNNSTNKRMMLFLRWMARKDDIDFGIFDFIKPCQLVYPMDVHLINIAKHFNILKFNTPTWKVAKEFTKAIAKFDKDDPLKYDYSLCHWDIKNREFNNG
ncbi:MAG TPA: TIGR02757 family protein [Ignavibacteriales bacterium]|nr:TIGR02757 family protein [Ignavibacteriales bacterium]